MKHSTLAICTAYEQGYGHGYDRRNLSNPYLSEEVREAWAFGHSEGERKRGRHEEAKAEPGCGCRAGNLPGMDSAHG